MRNAEDTASCNAIERCCVECRCDLDESTRSDSTYCSSACRQRAYRDRRRTERVEHEFWAALAGLARFIGDSRNAEVYESRNAAT